MSDLNTKGLCEYIIYYVCLFRKISLIPFVAWLYFILALKCVNPKLSFLELLASPNLYKYHYYQ